MDLDDYYTKLDAIKEELEELSDWKIRAFATRNAIRAIPFIINAKRELPWKQNAEFHLFAILHAIESAFFGTLISHVSDELVKDYKEVAWAVAGIAEDSFLSGDPFGSYASKSATYALLACADDAQSYMDYITELRAARVSLQSDDGDSETEIDSKMENVEAITDAAAYAVNAMTATDSAALALAHTGACKDSKYARKIIYQQSEIDLSYLKTSMNPREFFRLELWEQTPVFRIKSKWFFLPRKKVNWKQLFDQFAEIVLAADLDEWAEFLEQITNGNDFDEKKLKQRAFLPVNVIKDGANSIKLYLKEQRALTKSH